MTDFTIEITTPPPIDVTIETPAPLVVSLGAGEQGPPGPQGPQGEQGEQGEQGPQGEDAFYEHLQASASASWAITHNLGKVPSVTVIDSAGTHVEGAVTYDPADLLNKLTISFSVPFAGAAYLN